MIQLLVLEAQKPLVHLCSEIDCMAMRTNPFEMAIKLLYLRRNRKREVETKLLTSRQTHLHHALRLR